MSGHAEQWQVDDDDLHRLRPPQLALPSGDRPVVGYYDEDGYIVVRPYRGDAVILNPAEERGKPSGLELHAAGNRVYAAWRETRGGKSRLHMRTSLDGGVTWPGAAVTIDEVTEPLKRIVLAGDNDGHLHAAWLGERTTELSSQPGIAEVTAATAEPDDDGKDYHIYTRYSADGGKTWGSTYRLTEGYGESLWPALVARGAHAYSFSSSQRGQSKIIAFTKTQTGSDWEAPIEIASVGDVLLLAPYLAKHRLLATWLSHYPEKGYLLEGAVTEDEGATWARFVIPGSQGLDVANFDIAADGDRVYLALSGRRGRSSDKLDLYFARSTDGGHHWSKLSGLRQDQFAYTKAVYPRVDAGPPVMIIWNDFRNIRGDIYYNLSDDFGVSWHSHDLPLTARGQRNDYLYPFNEALTKAGGQYFLLAGRFQSDALAGPAKLLLHRFAATRADSPSDALGDTGSTVKANRLEQRAKHFWERLTAADYEAVYDFFDPFYRANHRKVAYLAATGRVVFNAFTIEDVTVAGNLGRVIVDYEYEVPPFRTGQGEVSRPPTRLTQGETWLFVDDDWYKEYRNELGDFSYARY